MHHFIKISVPKMTKAKKMKIGKMGKMHNNMNILNDTKETTTEKSKISKHSKNSSMVRKSKKQKDGREALLKLEKKAHSKMLLYNVSPENYAMMQLNNFVSAKYCHSLAAFKEKLIFFYDEEFLNKFFKMSFSRQKLPMFAEFYKSYQKFFCIPTFAELKLNDFIEEVIEIKARAYYNDNLVQEKMPKRKSINTIIFTSKIRKDISRRNTLTDLSKTTIGMGNKTHNTSYVSSTSIVGIVHDLADERERRAKMVKNVMNKKSTLSNKNNNMMSKKQGKRTVRIVTKNNKSTQMVSKETLSNPMSGLGSAISTEKMLKEKLNKVKSKGMSENMFSGRKQEKGEKGEKREKREPLTENKNYHTEKVRQSSHGKTVKIIKSQSKENKRKNKNEEKGNIKESNNMIYNMIKKINKGNSRENGKETVKVNNRDMKGGENNAGELIFSERKMNRTNEDIEILNIIKSPNYINKKNVKGKSKEKYNKTNTTSIKKANNYIKLIIDNNNVIPTNYKKFTNGKTQIKSGINHSNNYSQNVTFHNNMNTLSSIHNYTVNNTGTETISYRSSVPNDNFSKFMTYHKTLVKVNEQTERNYKHKNEGVKSGIRSQSRPMRVANLITNENNINGLQILSIKIPDSNLKKIGKNLDKKFEKMETNRNTKNNKLNMGNGIINSLSGKRVNVKAPNGSTTNINRNQSRSNVRNSISPEQNQTINNKTLAKKSSNHHYDNSRNEEKNHSRTSQENHMNTQSYNIPRGQNKLRIYSTINAESLSSREKNVMKIKNAFTREGKEKKREQKVMGKGDYGGVNRTEANKRVRALIKDKEKRMGVFTIDTLLDTVKRTSTIKNEEKRHSPVGSMYVNTISNYNSNAARGGKVRTITTHTTSSTLSSNLLSKIRRGTNIRPSQKQTVKSKK